MIEKIKNFDKKLEQYERNNIIMDTHIINTNSGI